MTLLNLTDEELQRRRALVGRKRRLSVHDELPDSTTEDTTESGETSSNPSRESNKKLKMVSFAQESVRDISSNPSGGSNKKVEMVSVASERNREPRRVIPTAIKGTHAVDMVIKSNKIHVKEVSNAIDNLFKLYKFHVSKYLFFLFQNCDPVLFIPTANNKLKAPIKKITDAIRELRKMREEADVKPMKSVTNLCTLMRAITIQGPTQVTGDMVLKGINREALLRHYDKYRVQRLVKMEEAREMMEELCLKLVTMKVYAEEAVEWCERIRGHTQDRENWWTQKLPKKRPASGSDTDSMSDSGAKVQKLDSGSVTIPTIRFGVRTSPEHSSSESQDMDMSLESESENSDESIGIYDGNHRLEKVVLNVNKSNLPPKLYPVYGKVSRSSDEDIDGREFNETDFNISSCNSPDINSEDSTQNRYQGYKMMDHARQIQSLGEGDQESKIEIHTRRLKSGCGSQPISQCQKQFNSKIKLEPGKDSDPFETIIECNPSEQAQVTDRPDSNGITARLNTNGIITSQDSNGIKARPDSNGIVPRNNRNESVESPKSNGAVVDSNSKANAARCNIVRISPRSCISGSTTKSNNNRIIGPKSNDTVIGPGSSGTFAIPSSSGAFAIPGSSGAFAIPGSSGAFAIPGSSGAFGGFARSDSSGAFNSFARPDNSGAFARPTNSGTFAAIVSEDYDPKEGCSHHYTDDFTDSFWRLSPETFRKLELEAKQPENNVSKLDSQKTNFESLNRSNYIYSNTSNQLESINIKRMLEEHKCENNCRCKKRAWLRRIELDETNDLLLETASEVKNFYLILDRLFMEIRGFYKECNDAQLGPLKLLQSFLKQPIGNLFENS